MSKNEYNLNDIAIDILKKIKEVVLIEYLKVSNEEKKFRYDKLYKSIENENTLNDKIYSIHLWDSNEELYKNLKKYLYDKLIYVTALEGENLKPRSSFVMNGILCLINILIFILEKEENAYRNDKIKFDINILVELISGKDEPILNDKYFYRQSIEELENEYNIIFNEKNNEEIIRLNEIIKDNGLQKINTVKNNLKNNIAQIFMLSYSEMNNYISNIKNFKDYEEKEINLNNVKIALYEFLEYKKTLDQTEDFINKCKNNKEIMNILNYYIEHLIKSDNIFLKRDSNYIIENIVFQEGIFEIDLNNQENLNIIYDIDCSKYIINETFREYEKIFYYQYLKLKKEEEDFKKLNNYEKEIFTLINNNDFLNEFFSILNSPSVSYFLNGKRKNPQDEKNQLIGNNNFNNFSNDDLSQQFTEFMKYINNDYHNLTNLIIIKQLGFKINSIVNSNMRIFINTKLDLNKEALSNEAKKSELLKAFLKLILLHEVVNLLKYFSQNDLENDIPKTPKCKEQMITYHLFNKDSISKINYHQSILINKKEIWFNSEELKSIFRQEEAEEKYNEEGEINLLITYDIPENKTKKK